MSNRSFRIAAVAAFLLAGVAAGADDAPKNLKVFPKDTGRQELIGVMKQWSQALGVRCDHCHVQAVPGDFQSFDFASDDKDTKNIARRMFEMVRNLNAATLPNAAGEDDARVSCVTCHRGLTNPATIDRVMLRSVDHDGAAAAVARYLELRARYYGSGSYDFGPRALLPLIESLAQRDGGVDDALRFAEMIAELYPEDADSRLVQAQLLLEKGDKAGAAAALAKALELDPDSRQAERLRRQLER